jgi:hypothetical protein
MTLKIRTADFNMRTILELLTVDVNELVIETGVMNHDFNRLLNQLGFYEAKTTNMLKTYWRL